MVIVGRYVNIYRNRHDTGPISPNAVISLKFSHDLTSGSVSTTMGARRVGTTVFFSRYGIMKIAAY